MKIHGLNKLTLLDYPGRVGATLFLGGCNFRCPFCQNAGLVLSPEKEPYMEYEVIMAFLKKRATILDGVCVSGGEPTLHRDLPQLMQDLKNLGYLVKLDTNGTNPAMIKALHLEGLIDYVAMDIKSSKENYGLVSGIDHLNLTAIEESANYLCTSGIDYEFRTTVVKELHVPSDFTAIGQWLAGCSRYFLQNYETSDNILHPGLSCYPKETLIEFQKELQKTIPLVELRGIEV